MKNTIEQIEIQGAQQLDRPIRNFLQKFYPNPEGHRLTVSLFDESGRKKRCSASPDNWSPESGEIRIRFEPADAEPEQATISGDEATSPSIASGGLAVSPSSEAESLAVGAAKQLENNTQRLTELLKALDRAESTPGWSFVPLRKFRDEILSSESVPLLPTDAERHAFLDLAIKNRFVLVGKVPNPKAPQFPVTTVRLNRLMPDVKRMLGDEDDQDNDFHPVEIGGEPMSDTIIRERRQQ
jgi:hypothetical protein